ncbi:hypothetical protein C815_01969 [Firmicutes bacterium M10-2]|nr:hypothetical protein C815_01969 [Firmicutes bacterium M10-2]
MTKEYRITVDEQGIKIELLQGEEIMTYKEWPIYSTGADDADPDDLSNYMIPFEIIPQMQMLEKTGFVFAGINTPFDTMEPTDVSAADTSDMNDEKE